MALSFEQQQPKPVAHRLVRSAQTIKVIKLSSDEEVSFSLEDETILQAFLSGHSIQEVILTLRQQNTRLSFSKIIEVLDQLYLNGLLQNGEEFAYHLDSLRWHYSWPESWLKSDFLKYGILPGVKDRSPLGGLLGLIGGILVIILLWSFSGHIYARANPGIFIINGAYWHFLLSLFVVSSSYFSLKTLLRGGLLYLANGRFPTLTVRLNGIGLYVDGYSSEDSDGLVYQINSLLSLAVGSLSIFILPLFLKVVQMPESLQTDFSAVIFFGS